jgi:Flp pilus assembly protein TadG
MRMSGRALLGRLAGAHRDDSGQMAIMFVLTLLVIFVFFALAFDAGLWYFDHRTAQNQSEAAALAAVQELPATDTSAATSAADEWLAKNGSGAAERYCLDYSDRNGDGQFDTARVCVRRESPGIFAALSGIDFVNISAAATASVGRVTMSNVMPWGIVPPDPTCTADVDRECQNPFNQDGVMEDCGVFEDCPWGLDTDRLYPFKLSSHITPGNFGAIAACGNGATNYRDCMTGQTVSGFWPEGETVQVDPQTGNLGQNTNAALADRYAQDGADGTYDCDVTSTPDATTGLDPDGKAAAEDKFAESPCDSRLVVVPIIDHFPQGHSDTILVLGVATFGIAKWDRNSPWGDALGTATAECGQASGTGFDCGMVWGYLMKDAQPPDFLLEQIGSDNPLAPLLIALVE